MILRGFKFKVNIHVSSIKLLTRLNRLHTCWVYLRLDLSWLLAWYKKSLELDQCNIIFAIQSQKIDDNDNQYSYSESMQFTFLFPCHISYTPFIPSSPRQTDRGIPNNTLLTIPDLQWWVVSQIIPLLVRFWHAPSRGALLALLAF